MIFVSRSIHHPGHQPAAVPSTRSTDRQPPRHERRPNPEHRAADLRRTDSSASENGSDNPTHNRRPEFGRSSTGHHVHFIRSESFVLNIP